MAENRAYQRILPLQSDSRKCQEHEQRRTTNSVNSVTQ